MTRTGRHIGIILAVLGSAALMGCSSTNWPPKYHATRTLVIPAQHDPVSVHADSPFGDLDLAAHPTATPHNKDMDAEFPAAGAGEVALLAVVRSDRAERLDGAEIAPRWDDDTLVLEIEWPDGKRRKNEGADWIVRVPTVGGVSGAYDFGDLTIRDPHGKVDLNSDFGDIFILEPRGPVSINADFGDIRIEHAHAPITINSDFGDVSLALTDDNAGPVHVESDFGDVTLSAGPAFSGDIAMDTDFGSASLIESSANPRSMKSRGSLSTTRGEGPRSSINTDFGDVSVRVRE